MRLFGKVNGTIDRFDRAGWLTRPFDGAFRSTATGGLGYTLSADRWKVGSTRTLRFSYDEVLETNELLTGTPTVIEVITSDLTIDNITVSASELTIKNEGVAAGRVLVFRASGHGVANAPYTLMIIISTDATPAQTFIRQLIISVEA